jgi:transcriptional regulator with XRE-family HTH domain
MPAFTDPPGSSKRRGPHPIDVMIGLKIQERRLQLGLTLDQLATKLGVRKQTISSYEQAKLHVTVTRLWLIAEALDRPIGWFFKNLERKGGSDA